MIARIIVAVAALALGSFLIWNDLQERRLARERCTPIAGSNAVICPAISVTQNN